jgi:hypothetical protein
LRDRKCARGGGGAGKHAARTFSDADRCWRAPAGSAGSAVTVGITLRRDGTMFGQFTINHLLQADWHADAQKRFVATALAALAACTPVAITDTLGGALARRRIFIRFESRPGQTRV